MITRTAHADLHAAAPAHCSPWRMDPPAPTGLQDLLLSAWPGALVAMVLLGLVLAFANVVRDGVRRGEQLRSQTSSAAAHCDAQAAPTLALQCADSDAPAGKRSTRMPMPTALVATRTLALQP